ncbi:MAG: rhomboid family intramembrane serine protease [Elusimicrobiota bacterium]|nr:rhomboid family intramembrane serine protease [Elusimicrobiota bacterium]
MAYRYYQQPLSSRQWGRAIKWLIIANISVYIIQMFAGRNVLYTFGLVPYRVVKSLWLWQILTHMFVHGGLFHLLINLFVLWMFGKPIERQWGTTSFLKYYFTCGLGASIFILLTSLDSRIPVVGASGAIYGILVAFAMLYPDSIIYLYFLFPIKAKHFAILIGAVAFLSGISGGKSNIAHFGHLGGLLVGYVYLKFPLWKYRFHPQRLLAFLRLPKISLRRRKKYKTEFYKIDDKVNQILDKILLHGVDSLTAEEKRIMDEYSSKEKQ